MNHSIAIVLAVAILAGAFPKEAHNAIDLAATWVQPIISSVTPSQLTAIVIGAVLLMAIGKR